MGFIKNLGKLAGSVTGGVIGGVVSIAGEITDIEFLKEVGEGVYIASRNAGEIIGQAAEGAVDIAAGIIDGNNGKIEEGFNELGEAVVTQAKRMGNGIKVIAHSAEDVIDGISQDDDEKLLNGAKTLAKAAVIATLAVGVGDYIGVIGDPGFDALGHDVGHVAHAGHLTDIQHTGLDGAHHVAFDSTHHIGNTDNHDIHFVQPHHVDGYVRHDGTEVHGYWRDGDGNTAIDHTVNQGGGYFTHDPGAS